MPLFDNDAKLIAGKFRIPFRNVPIKPFLHASELQRLEKVCELSPFCTVRNVYWYFLIKNKAIDFFHDKNKIILDWDRIVQVE